MCVHVLVVCSTVCVLLLVVDGCPVNDGLGITVWAYSLHVIQWVQCPM